MKNARLAVCLFVLAIVLQVPTIASANPGLAVQPIGGDTTASSLASMLVGSGVSVSNATYTGANNASGTFSGGEGIIGFGSGILLTSGDVNNVVGPNSSDSISKNNGGAGDSNLDTLSTFTTHDASVLQFDFTSTNDTVFFQYVFASDEYNEYVNTAYNDTFGFFVNGVNCATVGGDPITINKINKNTHSDLYRNNDRNDFPPVDNATPIDTEMDGLTVVLTCQVAVSTTAPNHLKLAIADASDFILDSAVFLKQGSFSTTPPASHTLSVTLAGTGTGNVVSDPSGISCPGIDGPCSNQFVGGTDVTLTATPASGSAFSGWTGGGCSGTGTCTVTMSEDKAVTATFVPQNTLTVTNPGSGSGIITFNYDETSTSCTLTPSTSCSKTFDPGTPVTLSASAASGSTFFGWTGEGCSGTGPCPVTMDSNKTVNAIFNQNSTGNTATGFVPPGGTIQTCQNTSSTDNTCSAITLPNGGPGATITITEQAGSTSTVCNGPCSNQTTTYSITCVPAAPCYTDINNPPKVILRYRVPGTSTKADMYFLHSSTSTPFKIPDCRKNGIANPNPCVSARKRLGIGNNNLQVQVLVTSDDPIIGKR